MSENSVEVILTTAPSRTVAVELARTLVEERLIGCATLVPGAESIYRWEGAVEEAEEVVLLLKSTAAQRGALEARLMELHPYDTPEFVVLQATHVGARYAGWLGDCLRSPVV